MKKFILIGNKKRMGKDTFAKMLKDNLGDAEILSFADPIKTIIAQQKGISVELLEELKNQSEAVRDEVKNLGNGLMIDYFGEKVWRDILINKAKKLDCKYIIVPDFRFKREFINGALTINVVRDSITTTDEHQSETELDDWMWNIKVNNSLDLEYLNLMSMEVCEVIKGY